MKTVKNNKRLYKKPRISRVKLDNEISLVMMSPTGNPPWANANESSNVNNPFRSEEMYG